MVDFERIQKVLVDAIKSDPEKENIAAIQYACIPLVIAALKLYDAELNREKVKLENLQS